MRQLYRVLLHSRVGLEQASGRVRDKWVKDVLFILACRRSIMMNLLDRELGSLPVRVEVDPEAGTRFLPYLAGNSVAAARPEGALLEACQEEEHYLQREFRDLVAQPGLGQRTRQIIGDLLLEVEENLSDLRFLNGTARA